MLYKFRLKGTIVLSIYPGHACIEEDAGSPGMRLTKMYQCDGYMHAQIRSKYNRPAESCA